MLRILRCFTLVWLGIFPLRAEWTAIEVPSAWEDQGHPELDGFAWYRCFVVVPEAWEGSRFLLTVGRIDDVDETYFNGERVGANGGMPPLYGDPSSSVRRPAVIEPDQVRFGKPNLIAFRVYDKGGRGGILDGPIQLSRVDDAIDLSGKWEFAPGDQSSRGAWSNGEPESKESAQWVEAFRRRAGEKAAGHLGIVAASKELRARQIAEVRERFENNSNVHSNVEGKGEPLPPLEAEAQYRLGSGLALDTVLSEPLVRQPLHLDFDERGRLWVTQYIQYPKPAGLEILTWDNHLRTVFDAVPPPPPYEEPEKAKFMGRDKITIHEDTDGDGVFDKHKTFLDGLNLVTSTAVGRGGVWVMNPPYLLFYPDADGDDIPDGDPIVHLSGFGLEDTHSIANSLEWGPDGWLYGAVGSTVTARVKVALAPGRPPLVFFGQNIWRYHPETHAFELFAEGGWNTFGVDFDAQGRLFSGTNGSMQAVHFVQGGYYQKSFGKHGPHTNPFAFDYFHGIPIEGNKQRLVHQWLPYHGDALPGREGHFIGVNSLANEIVVLALTPDGSSFRSTEQEKAVQTEHPWFRPVHAVLGPDGAVYIADFYDARITHVDPRDNWDRDHGRVYRLRAAHAKPRAPFNLAVLPSLELVDLLDHPNHWYRRTARRLLADRQDVSVVPALEERFRQRTGQTALESLWALHTMKAFNETLALAGLRHENPHVRMWTVRLLGEDGSPLSDRLLQAMLSTAGESAEIASQIASTAARLPVGQSLTLLHAILSADRYSGDPFIPAQLWWALESCITRDCSRTLAWLGRNETIWRTTIFETALASRFARRLASDPTETNLEACAQLMELAPHPVALRAVVAGIEEGLRGITLASVPPALDAVFAKLWESGAEDAEVIAFGIRLGGRRAQEAAIDFIDDPNNPEAARLQLLNRIAEVRHPALEGVLLEMVRSEQAESLRLAALNALRRSDNETFPALLIDEIPSMENPLRDAAISLLAGQAPFTEALLTAVERGEVAREAIGTAHLLVMKQHQRESIDEAIEKLWGRLRAPSETMQARIETVREILESGTGDAARGAPVFTQLCAACHRLFDEGGTTGPDLTGYERSNREFLLAAVVDPNLGIREEFELVTITLRPSDGGSTNVILSGYVQNVGEARLTLKDLTGNETVLAEADILSREHLSTSIMPEGLLEALTDTQIRDLFAFLQSSQKP